jgi:hypothetical protein
MSEDPLVPWFIFDPVAETRQLGRSQELRRAVRFLIYADRTGRLLFFY